MKAPHIAETAVIAAQLMLVFTAVPAAKAQGPVNAADRGRPGASTPVSQGQSQGGNVPVEEVRQEHSTAGEDIFAGTKFSEGEQLRIDEIRKEMRARMELVAKDNRETPDQKEAMIEGLQRMERRQVFMALTPEQRSAVVKRLSAQRAATQQKAQSQQTSSAKRP